MGLSITQAFILSLLTATLGLAFLTLIPPQVAVLAGWIGSGSILVGILYA